MKLVITSGYFNPLHRGHVSCIEQAKKLGDKLIVIVNNDHQVELKGSKVYLDQNERLYIVKSLRAVDDALISSSSDKTVCVDLENLRKRFPKDELIFAKGGDRNKKDAADKKSPLYADTQICKKLNIKIIFNVGEEKIQSSSKILEKMHNK
jgi:D-beta-D-heptose 7-phosphate kinase/D-beta-D-heptose 1-phosphate adenosyltransferase